MSIKHSIAQRRKWANVPKEDRSDKMRAIALAKHAKMTKRQKTKQALVMRSGHNKNLF